MALVKLSESKNQHKDKNEEKKQAGRKEDKRTWVGMREAGSDTNQEYTMYVYGIV